MAVSHITPPSIHAMSRKTAGEWEEDVRQPNPPKRNLALAVAIPVDGALGDLVKTSVHSLRGGDSDTPSLGGFISQAFRGSDKK